MSLVSRLSRLRPGTLKTFRTGFAILTLAAVIVFVTLGYNYGALYYELIATAIVPALLYALLRRAVPLADARVRARKRWMGYGPDVERVPYTVFEELRSRYGQVRRDDERGFVDDRTWYDLGMDEVHDRIDVCFTMSGRNELYRILRHALPEPADVDARRAVMTTLATDEAERQRIGQHLAGIGEERDADPATLLWGDAVKTDDLLPLFIAMCVLAFTSIALIFVASATLGIIAMLAVFFTNMWIYYRKARNISADVPALRVLTRMIHAARHLPWHGLPALSEQTSGSRRAFRWLLTGAPSPSPTFSGDLTEVFLLYIKIFFQIDLLAYNRIVSHITRHREIYRALYSGIGSIDAAYSLASYRARRKRTCDAVVATPTSGASGAGYEIRLEGAYHPLISKAVPNSVTIGAPGAIVTGTNMAGKSTFLRTVGINVLFAQTAGFAFATAYEAPRCRVMSSIEKHDDLASGKSFYYDEAERIYGMIEEVGSETPVLLLIDELLSGTNSLERESASVAILHYLAERHAITIAATHDVAIANGVADRFSLHYFTDDANETGLTFDYKIHDGVVQTRNAIKLLRLIGYPEDVITTALERTGAT